MCVSLQKFIIPLNLAEKLTELMHMLFFPLIGVTGIEKTQYGSADPDPQI